MIKKFSELLLFGSIFIAACAVAMCVETNLLLHLPLNDPRFYVFVAGATLVQYNMHYLFKTSAVQGSTRLAWSLRNKALHRVLILVGTAMILFSLSGFKLRHYLVLLVFGALASLYSFPLLPFKEKKRIKDFGLLKIITLALLWTLVTVWFPADQAHLPGLSFQLIFIRRFIFIFILCLVFDIRDMEIDGRQHINTVAIQLGNKKAYWLCYALLALFAALSFIQFLVVPDAAQLVAMLLSAAATIIPIEMSKKNNSDILFLAFIDGMMLLQALLVIFATRIGQ